MDQIQKNPSENVSEDQTKTENSVKVYIADRSWLEDAASRAPISAQENLKIGVPGQGVSSFTSEESAISHLRANSYGDGGAVYSMELQKDKILNCDVRNDPESYARIHKAAEDVLGLKLPLKEGLVTHNDQTRYDNQSFLQKISRDPLVQNKIIHAAGYDGLSSQGEFILTNPENIPTTTTLVKEFGAGIKDRPQWAEEGKSTTHPNFQPAREALKISVGSEALDIAGSMLKRGVDDPYAHRAFENIKIKLMSSDLRNKGREGNGDGYDCRNTIGHMVMGIDSGHPMHKSSVDYEFNRYGFSPAAKEDLQRNLSTVTTQQSFEKSARETKESDIKRSAQDLFPQLDKTTAPRNFVSSLEKISKHTTPEAYVHIRQALRTAHETSDKPNNDIKNSDVQSKIGLALEDQISGKKDSKLSAWVKTLPYGERLQKAMEKGMASLQKSLLKVQETQIGDER